MALDHERSAQPEWVGSGAVRSFNGGRRADDAGGLQLGDDHRRIAVLEALRIREVLYFPPYGLSQLAGRFAHFLLQLIRRQEGEDPVRLPVRSDLEQAIARKLADLLPVQFLVEPAIALLRRATRTGD